MHPTAALSSTPKLPMISVMVQQTSSGLTTYMAPTQYVIGGSALSKGGSTSSTPTTQQSLAFSTLSVGVAAPPMPQLFINTQAASPLIQPVTLLGYQPQLLAQSPMATQYRPLPTTPVQGTTYTPLHIAAATPPVATPPGTTLRTSQAYTQVWQHR